MKRISLRGRFVLFLDIIICTGMIVTLSLFSLSQTEKNMEESVQSIQRSVFSMGQLIYSYFNSQQQTLQTINTYAIEKQLSFLEVIDLLTLISQKNKLQFQIIEENTYMGYSLDSSEKYPEVDYSDSSYGSLQNSLSKSNIIFGSIGITAEFANYLNGINSVAIFLPMHFYSFTGDTTIEKSYVVMQIVELKNLFQSFVDLPLYKNYSASLINSKGDYIFKQGNFQGVNFFNDLAFYNNLNNEKIQEIAEQVVQSSDTSLIMNNSKGEPAYYYFLNLGNSKNWHYVMSVPITSLWNNKISYLFNTIFFVFILSLAFVNFAYILKMNRNMKKSLEETKIANLAKTEFLSRMSHDMRTPMNGIIGMTELTLAENDLSPKVRENIETIKEAGNFLLQLINDTLDMSKIESNKMTLNPVPVNAEKFLKSALIIPQLAAEKKKINFETYFFNINFNTCVYLDPLRVQQIFLNVLSNAIKFTPDYGNVTLTAEVISRKNDKVEVEFTVTDNGVGISKEFLNKIFIPFEQEYNCNLRPGSGTGLGLTIVKKLVDMMNGSITVDSVLGEGTWVSILLPFDLCIKEEKKEESEQKTLNQDLLFINKRVLLVEDNQINAMVAKQILESKKMIVESVSNGLDAVKKVRTNPPLWYDVVFMDIRMPIMDGIEATKNIRNIPSREDLKTLPIIAMTANAFDDDIKCSKEAGMNDHLAKPIDITVLFNTLARYLSPETEE